MNIRLVEVEMTLRLTGGKKSIRTDHFTDEDIKQKLQEVINSVEWDHNQLSLEIDLDTIEVNTVVGE